MMELTSANVDTMTKLCLTSQEDSDKVEVTGVVHAYIFNKHQIEANKTSIHDMLKQLPEQFMATKGGWSFLMACNRADGEQWTGLHLMMGNLFALGEAAGLVTCLLPRPMWGALPGGMPYYSVQD